MQTELENTVMGGRDCVAAGQNRALNRAQPELGQGLARRYMSLIPENAIASVHPITTW